jgi:hypothetical protein
MTEEINYPPYDPDNGRGFIDVEVADGAGGTMRDTVTVQERHHYQRMGTLVRDFGDRDISRTQERIRDDLERGR